MLLSWDGAGCFKEVSFGCQRRRSVAPGAGLEPEKSRGGGDETKTSEEALLFGCLLGGLTGGLGFKKKTPKLEEFLYTKQPPKISFRTEPGMLERA